MGHPGWVLIVSACFALPAAGLARGQADLVDGTRPERVATATRLDGDQSGIKLDGQLDEPAWALASWISGLTQKDPVEGPPGAELTEVAFLYDDHDLYVGARLSTPLTGPVRTRTSPRDDMGQTQSFFISMDTYHDLRTAYTFGVTAAGVRVDFHHPQDAELNQVLSWDPVWDVRTRVLEDHWIVEARIPFSQLRFNPSDEQVWGLQIDRWTPERNAEDYWCMVPRAETGWASRFGELRGIRGIKPARRLELLPYAAGELQLLHSPDPNDPFAKESAFSARAGGDLKMGLGPNLTLDATFNPDFGQVEADPANINLSAFETFFDERRPFFLEGDRLLRGQGPRYYYSRRIGAPPRGNALPDTVTHVDMPASSRILGAAKLSGRLSGGLSVGALAAVTDVEHADIHNQASGGSATMRIQPRTGSGILRLQQDLPATGSVVGLSLTGLHRDFDGDGRLADFMAEDAVAGGLDMDLRMRDGLHSLVGNWGFSRVQGDTLAILALQRSPVHYFQRPDAGHVHLDPGREAITGWTGALELNRIGGRHWRWSVGTSAESPGLELNDLGQLGSADDIDSWVTLNWEEHASPGFFRRYSIWHNYFAGWNFGGLPTNAQTELGFWGQFHSYWSMDLNVNHGRSVYSDHLTRGGMTMMEPGWTSANISFNSPDLQRPNAVSGGMNGSWGEDRRLSLGAWTFGRFRPGPRVEIRLNPSVTRDWNPAQYIATLSPSRTGLTEDLTIFSRLEYREFRLAARLRYSFTPKLRMEVYAEPFMASLRFDDPGRPVAPMSQHIRRYRAEDRLQPLEGGGWQIEEDAGTIELSQSNLEFASWRSTFVLRWEWRLGSTFYLVWQQDREHFIPRDDPDRTPDPLRALSTGGDNLIALKFSSWFPVG